MILALRVQTSESSEKAEMEFCFPDCTTHKCLGPSQYQLSQEMFFKILTESLSVERKTHFFRLTTTRLYLCSADAAPFNAAWRARDGLGDWVRKLNSLIRAGLGRGLSLIWGCLIAPTPLEPCPGLLGPGHQNYPDNLW